jgi:hypothetical protein
MRGTGLAAVLVALLSGCGSTQQITETPFEQAAGDAASVMSAAAVTLRFIHAEPASMTVEYAAGSMINYADEVSSVPDELPTLSGAPDAATVQDLVEVIQPAVDDIESPCLMPDCDWQSQVDDLETARDAILDATQ